MGNILTVALLICCLAIGLGAGILIGQLSQLKEARHIAENRRRFTPRRASEDPFFPHEEHPDDIERVSIAPGFYRLTPMAQRG